jgi:cytochrome c peroxidase
MFSNRCRPWRHLRKLRAPVAIAAACAVSWAAAAQLDDWLRPADIPQPAANASTPERVALGRALFFDPRLSGSNQMSCASCHNPALAWSDGRPVAVGDKGQPLQRATPSILNSAFQTALMWDGRAATLEQQAIMPISDADEMNQPLPALVQELAQIPGYRKLFEAAYPGQPIAPDTVALALAAFQRTVVSSDAPFDRFRRGDKTALSDSARRGFDVFRQKGNCAVCHMGFNFTDDDFHNIGVRDTGAPDLGRYALTKQPEHRGAFKTPTLRDVALTAPYMRNGLYTTLEEVVEHYNRGGDGLRETTSPHVVPLKLTAQEKADLVAFMQSLTGTGPVASAPELPR